WGRHFMGLTDFFLNYIPGYNKFRAVSMTLVIAELTLPIMALLGLDYILKNIEVLRKNGKQKMLFVSFGIVGGLTLLFWLVPDLFNSFGKQNEFDTMFSQYKAQLKGQISDDQIKSILNNALPIAEEVRAQIFRADSIRSFGFILAAFLAIFAYFKKTFEKEVLAVIILVLVVGDLWTVNKRYLDKENYVAAKKMEKPVPKAAHNQQILADTEPNFRVFNTTARLDQDSRTSYYHNNLGGYHGAKSKRYQELIDFHLGRGNRGVVNMLNTKYYIVQEQSGGQGIRVNPERIGPAWFVNELQIVENADSEITALSNFNPKDVAFVDQRFESSINPNISRDSLASITLTSYSPKELVYKLSNNADGFAVFSEIYYQPGWNAYLDGAPAEHVRVNYVLRGMNVPSGNHEVVFKFEPESYYTGEKISLGSSLILIIVVLGALGMTIKSSLSSDSDELISKNPDS
ncbi:MAG: YfhO family protein, partial [Flavobacteriales bacterium]|nr:YfhO family protein [Flavobacteriales bacterium]